MDAPPNVPAPMSQWERAGWHLMDANRAAHELDEMGARGDHHAKLELALLWALRAAGIRTGFDDEALRLTLEAERPERVRIIVTTGPR